MMISGEKRLTVNRFLEVLRLDIAMRPEVVRRLSPELAARTESVTNAILVNLNERISEKFICDASDLLLWRMSRCELDRFRQTKATFSLQGLSVKSSHSFMDVEGGGLVVESGHATFSCKSAKAELEHFIFEEPPRRKIASGPIVGAGGRMI